MGRLLYSVTASLDGYTADTSGSIDWTAPDEEVHTFVNDRLRRVGTYLFGRRMYETMRVWEDMDVSDEPAPIAEFAEMWKDTDKVVYSTTLTAATTARTRIEPAFHPETVRALVRESPRDVEVGGPTLAEVAFEAGIVDEVQLYIVPVSIGGGTPALPTDQLLSFELQEQRVFGNGTVFLHYRVTPPTGA